MKILVVHQSESVIKQIKFLVSHVNPYIRCFKSGLDGLIAMQLETYDLLICATNLPMVTGYELARSVRHTSDRSQTAIIFISDGVDKNVVLLGLKLQVFGIVEAGEIAQTLPSMVVDATLKVKHDVNFYDSIN